MKTLAVYNIKGGVGKTASSVNLAYLAAAGGGRVLVWDLDPQGAASFYFRVKPKVKGGSKGLVKGAQELESVIKSTQYEKLDLLPADFSYRKLDLQLAKTGKDTRLARILKPARRTYDYVFLDCPPSISPLSESIFRAADALLVPMLPTTLSLRSFEQLRSFCEDKASKGLTLLPFFTMVDRRKRMHKDTLVRFPQQSPDCLPVTIPYSSIVERMGLEQAPLGAFAPGSPAGRAYAALWRAISARID